MNETPQDIIKYYTPKLQDTENQILGIECKYDGLIPDGDQNYLNRLRSDAGFYAVRIQKAENDLLRTRISKLIDAVIKSRGENAVVDSGAYMLALELKVGIES